ncbi:hypothetical protein METBISCDRAFT_13070 [Metschnikowia bicuspidata]|uniref:Uncharacterized protein n=1 Tax=Metschnikowia bicuspidata TaxID=27322 RepID=A0A4P9ZG40_9ASCO|nr:hypothetical protein METBISCDRAFT_13070 [Metschnikowia bicuspidata]
MRLSRHRRPLSVATANPTIKRNPFSERRLPTNLLDLPHDTYPNPLLSFNNDEILRLREPELQHLLSIPGGSPAEQEQLFLNVVQLVNDHIVSDTSRAAHLLEAFESSALELPISACLKASYKTNVLRRSILSFLECPSDKQARHDIQQVLRKMLAKLQSEPHEAVHMILNYFQKLAAVRTVNPFPIYLSSQTLELLLQHLSALEKRSLFSYLVQANLKFADDTHYYSLKTTLFNGGPLSKLVTRTGLMDAKWHDVAKFEYSDTQKQRMLNFFRFSELKYFAETALLEKNILDANLYLELLVSKFERSDDSRRLQDVLEVMLVHSMIVKGAPECVRFFRYNLQSGLSIEMGTVLKVLARLREDGLLDEALFLINFLHREKLSQQQRCTLVSEIMHVITKKFEGHPQIVVGYFAALFNDSSKSALRLLKDLLLLDAIYSEPGVSASITAIKEADIHEDLKNSKLQHSFLYSVHSVTLRSLDLEQSTNPQFISELFDAYLAQVKRVMQNDDRTSIFHQDNIDESVVTLFAEYLLREDPHNRKSMTLSDRELNFETARRMVDSFWETVHVSRPRRKTYLADLMIYSSLMQHNDVNYALKVLKHACNVGLPVSFNQIYPFIVFHLLRKEHDRALQWYQILVKNGVKARLRAADDLFDIAKKLNWPVKGSSYRSAHRSRNRKIRSDSALIALDSLSVLSTDPQSHKLFDFVGELAAVLNAASGNKTL